ncbi:glycosyltransferase family 2 protein [Olleya namhaensis]|uniref:Glycosyltransferase involved in cell wall bisynthesis n=1 Tax=Olleya namhaensis TaxID=1144750 RepID=A0A1I3NJ05_9FLAO|nr:glycosyltransferase family 2 protein [Olleya namhaensis]SFJ09293.1 Glycosyltransferase involved in cell wall bisynthesis [Olleya namhaensis]
MKPTVTIIMATYNRAQYIVESIKSIQAQTFKNWECLIIDDGGTDNTAEVLGPILIEDNRFSYLKRTDNYTKGLPGSRNYGLDIAKGDYIIFFDDDDIAHPQNLELCVSEFKTKNIDFCRYIRAVFTGDFNYNYDFSKEYTHFEIDKKDVNRILKNELLFNSCAIMWKKECFVTNHYIEHLMYAEEWELYSRIVSQGYKGVSIDKILFYGRKHEASNTGEFFNQDPVRIKSNAAAIVLVIQNLKKEGLLSNSIIRYFIQVSLDYKPYDLFKRIIKTLELTTQDTLKWNLYYSQLPLRLFFYRLYKKHLK